MQMHSTARDRRVVDLVKPNSAAVLVSVSAELVNRSCSQGHRASRPGGNPAEQAPVIAHVIGKSDIPVEIIIVDGNRAWRSGGPRTGHHLQVFVVRRISNACDNGERVAERIFHLTEDSCRCGLLTHDFREVGNDMKSR